MIQLYSDEDLWNTFRQRGRILAVFFGVILAYIAAFVGFMIYFTSLPYEDPNQTWVKWTIGAITVAFIFFCFPFMGIKFKRVNAYYRMLKFISVGLKENSVAPFAGIEDWTTKDGVDVNVACFTVRGAKRGEEMIRHIYVDGEKDYPPFYEGDVVRFVSQGNLLLSYEIIQKAEPSAMVAEEYATNEENTQEKGEE